MEAKIPRPSGADGCPTIAVRPVQFTTCGRPPAPLAVTDDERAREQRRPQYTQYPTEDRFSEAFGAVDYLGTLRGRSNVGAPTPLSLYVHVPFCTPRYHDSNPTNTPRGEESESWLRRVLAEAALVDANLGTHGGGDRGRDRRLSRLHLGGGTSSLLAASELMALMRGLCERFELLRSAERSIEIDPYTVDAARFDAIATARFDRMRLEVRDVDLMVQRTNDRVQPQSLVAKAVAQARSRGVSGIDVDLIYGLPQQCVTTMTRTVQQVIELAPERVTLKRLAHLPSRFPTGRQIDAAMLPSPAESLDIVDAATGLLEQADYRYIGMDQFAKRDDPLTLAWHSGRLHRTVQGFSTRPDRDLIALGPSAISRVGVVYAQNAMVPSEWGARIDAGQLATSRGLACSADDLLRHAVIDALLCQGCLDKSALESAWLIDFDSVFACELDALAGHARDGHVRLDDDTIRVTERGRRLAARRIASVFDRHRVDPDRAQTPLSAT